jgi:hypothetical protein
MDGVLRKRTDRTWEGTLHGYRVQVFDAGGGWHVAVINDRGHVENCPASRRGPRGRGGRGRGSRVSLRRRRGRMPAMRTPALRLCLAVPIPAPEPVPVPHSAAAFTPGDVARAEGRVVHFYGVVEELDAFEELHVAYLATAGLSGHRWHAILDGQVWRKLQPGDRVALRGVLRTHVVDGERYAVIWAVP